MNNIKINIQKGTENDIQDCVTEVMESELGKRAFKEVAVAHKVISEGIAAGEIYIARSSENKFLGVIRSAPKGMFNGFPYLHLLAVAKDMRGKGIGSKLLDYFKKLHFKDTERLGKKSIISLLYAFLYSFYYRNAC